MDGQLHVDRPQIAILDFGSQYSHLIARRVRELNVFCELYSCLVKGEVLRKNQVVGIILSGGPNSVYEERMEGGREGGREGGSTPAWSRRIRWWASSSRGGPCMSYEREGGREGGRGGRESVVHANAVSLPSPVTPPPSIPR